jgi:hypothetical protein
MAGRSSVETKRALLERFKVTDLEVESFSAFYAPVIQAYVTQAEQAYTHLWIADKGNRIAEYQADVDRINTALEGVDETDRAFSNLVKAKHAALKNVSEELGQLPLRSSVRVQRETLQVTVEGAEAA